MTDRTTDVVTDKVEDLQMLAATEMVNAAGLHEMICCFDTITGIGETHAFVA
ncbi:hypothetical protein SAMN04487983_102361 [Streptomyces sp. yr375]|uniref:hypothetical protein n=1 Tax=Streptomyces sp. yr375 TaxID=1761906 RepID=UPI0008B36DAF|nr:hypothetical protein [Streptomyces sp. yr375]SER83988.1 hypothetical protein SAMN04487983_102361 [Streptomyces sp. yr375]